MKNVNCTVLSASDSASQNGSQIDANQLVNVSFHAHLGDSTANGTLKVQASNDLWIQEYMPSNFTVSNWVDIPNATATITSGSPALISLSNIAYRWLRVVYTSSSGGSSTITVNMFGVSV